MKKTTARARCFKTLLGAFFFALLFSACGVQEKTLSYHSFYQGYSVEGAHARALAVTDKHVVVGGKDGYVSINFLDSSLWNVNKSRQMADIEDFRDVHFTDLGDCFFMNSGENGIIYRITRFGSQAKVLDTAGVFLDGLDFWDAESGIVYGDPVGGKFFLAKTTDKGETWQALKPKVLPPALENEGGFAASGSGIQTIGDSAVYFATGLGQTARLFCSYDRGEHWRVKDTPMRSGDSYGIYSMFFWSENEGLIVGGSYVDSTYNEGICQFTNNGGDSWKSRSTGLAGYCSCVHGTPNGDFIVATGRMGTFYTLTKGKVWHKLTDRAFYTCSVSSRYIILSGRDGTLEFFEYEITEN